jgi:DNA-binding CsgD family transcriptional regulator
MSDPLTTPVAPVELAVRCVSHNVPESPEFRDFCAPAGAPPEAPDDAAHEDATPLSDRQRRAVNLLVRGMSATQVAKSIGVDRRTVYRWRRQGAFINALNRDRKALRRDADDRLLQLLPGALDVLQRHLDDPYDRTAYRAAALLLRTAFQRKRPAHRRADPIATERNE